MRYASLSLGGLLLLIVGAASAAELQGPVVIGPTPGAKPPMPPAGCPPIPRLSADVTMTSIVLRRAARTIGPFSVELDGYVTSNEPPSYRPILLLADPGGSLVLDFVVDPSVGAVISNLHTHGLIVKPRPAREPHVSAPCPPGDYIFVHAGPAEAGGGGGSPPHLDYRVDIPKTLPAALLGRIDPQSSGASAPYPNELYWIHSHLHGVSGPQVTEGMSGVISVGPEKDSIAPYPPSVRDATDVRYLALRDIQLLSPCPTKNGAPDCSGTIPSLESVAAGSPAEDAGESYNDGLCGNPDVPKVAWCAGLLIKAANNPIAFQYWLFTVTGQLDPTITLPAGRNHLWRVANLSANVSYVLKLCDVDSVCKDPATGLHPMTVVSEDGVQTGSRTSADGPTTLGVEVDRLLMMPASRAAILIRNDEAALAARHWQLRNERLDTGPGPIVAGVPTETGDTWPNMALAEVQLEGSGAAAAAQMRAAVPESVSMRRVTQTRSTSIGRDPASRPDCSFLPRDDAAHKYRRQIIFDEDNANSIFRLGSQRVDQNGVLVADGRNIAPAQFPHAGANGDTGDDFPPGPHVCATLHRGEVWELINSTDELHNFHIHQDKFRLARRGDPGVPDGGDSFQPFQDPSHLLDGLVADDPRPDPSRDLWHDTFPVPPRKGDVNGRVFVFIPFEAEEQVWRFVFHCHILEHEDDGMMAAMEVVHEIPEKDKQTGGRGHVERQRLLDLADEVERVAALAVELVDKGQDRHVAQPVDLEELAGLLSKPAWCRSRAQ